MYFAMNRPYTYSMMVNDTKLFENQFLSMGGGQLQVIKSFLSICCNIIPALIITDKIIEPVFEIEEVKIPVNKKVLVFMARQHPG